MGTFLFIFIYLSFYSIGVILCPLRSYFMSIFKIQLLILSQKIWMSCEFTYLPYKCLHHSFQLAIESLFRSSWLLVVGYMHLKICWLSLCFSIFFIIFSQIFYIFWFQMLFPFSPSPIPPPPSPNFLGVLLVLPTHSNLITLTLPYIGQMSLHRTKGFSSQEVIDPRQCHPLLDRCLESWVPPCLLNRSVV